MRYCWCKPDDNQILIITHLLHLHAALRHHFQLFQGVGFLRVPDGSDYIYSRRQVANNQAALPEFNKRYFC